MRTRRHHLAAAALAAAVVAAGCGAADEDVVDAGTAVEDATGDPAGAEETAPTGPTLDVSVLSGQAMTVTGESFDLGSLADKDLVVWFWAPW
ncbi:MAG: hypothetical protein ACR2QK_07715 [Acidimicrobiales bacterium]